MTSTYFFEIVQMFILPLLAVLVPVFIGQWYGGYRRKKSTDLQHTPVGAVVGAAMGLLAFMLAFTFQIAANRYDARKQLLLEEVTQIRTAWLRAGLIPEPYRSGSKKQLVEYVDLRVELIGDYSKRKQLIARSQQILDSLWKYTEELAEQDRSSEVYALFTTSVNDMVDVFNQRITMAWEYRIPVTVLWILFIIEFFSMLVLGYQFGISGKGSVGLNLVLSVIFAMVLFLIFALDRPETGLVKINQQPMITLQQQLSGK